MAVLVDEEKSSAPKEVVLCDVPKQVVIGLHISSLR